MCCGYGNDGLGVSGFDCLILPGAAKMTNTQSRLPYDEFCGRSRGLVTSEMKTTAATQAAPMTICCRIFFVI